MNFGELWSIMKKNEHSSDAPERRFNLIVYGLEEYPRNIPRFKLAEEVSHIVTLLRSASEDIAPHSVRSCFRLRVDAKRKDPSCE